jgi:hypothetical protein
VLPPKAESRASERDTVGQVRCDKAKMMSWMGRGELATRTRLFNLAHYFEVRADEFLVPSVEMLNGLFSVCSERLRIKSHLPIWLTSEQLPDTCRDRCFCSLDPGCTDIRRKLPKRTLQGRFLLFFWRGRCAGGLDGATGNLCAAAGHPRGSEAWGGASNSRRAI